MKNNKFDFLERQYDNINMDISINSITANKLNSIQETASIKMLKSTLELQKDMAAQIIKALQLPDIGKSIDVKA